MAIPSFIRELEEDKCCELNSNDNQFKSGPVVHANHQNQSKLKPQTFASKIILIIILLIPIVTVILILSSNKISNFVTKNKNILGVNSDKVCSSDITGINLNLPNSWKCIQENNSSTGSFKIIATSNDDNGLKIEIGDNPRNPYCLPSENPVIDENPSAANGCKAKNYFYSGNIFLNYYKDSNGGEIYGTFMDAFRTSNGGVYIVVTYNGIGTKELDSQTRKNLEEILKTVSHR